MAAVDVIVSWPRPCDHPRWRQFIRDERDRFGEVFVVLTELAGPDMSPFLRSAMPEVTFIDSPPTDGRDWRDVAVNAALDRSRAEYVWFTEQDFFVTDPDHFWPQLTGPVAGIFANDGRVMHPACILARRDLIDRTSRYFGPDPLDHFHTFTAELPTPRIVEGGYRHFQAISESQMLLWLGQQPRFRPEQWREWVALNLSASVPIDPTWRALVS